MRLGRCRRQGRQDHKQDHKQGGVYSGGWLAAGTLSEPRQAGRERYGGRAQIGQGVAPVWVIDQFDVVAIESTKEGLPVDAALWITTLSTLGLLLAAVAAGFIAWRALTAEQERDLRAQAAQIGAWTATRERQPQGRFGLCLLNDSSLPVTDLDVLVLHGTDNVDSQHYQHYEVLPPGFYFAPSTGPDAEGRFGHFGRPEPMERGTLDLKPTMVYAESSNVERFSFVDATGQRWQRKLRVGPGETPLIRIAHRARGRDGENV